MKRTKTTVELISVPCVCGKAALRATVTRLSVGVLSANVPDKVHPCPACGSTDLKAAREAEAERARQKSAK